MDGQSWGRGRATERGKKLEALLGLPKRIINPFINSVKFLRNITSDFY